MSFALRNITGAAAVVLCGSLTAHAVWGSADGQPHPWKNTALYFEGGAGPGSVFRARGCNYEFLIGPTEVGVWLKKPVGTDTPGASRRALSTASGSDVQGLRITFPEANREARVEGQQPSSARIHYLQGTDPAKWRRSLSAYAAVRVSQIYPGMDVVYYGNQRQLEYDFEVSPGANPALIRIAFEGADRLELTEAGALRVHVGDQTIEQPAPVIYQLDRGERKSVDGGYRLVDAHTIGFWVGAYDPERLLVLDPILSYSTYFGGNQGDIALAVKVDPEGNVYVAGQTLSTRFPFTVPPGGFQTSFGGGKINGDAYVAKFAPNGSLVFFTYLGGDGNDGAVDIALDALGQPRIAGFTDSPDFPVRNALYSSIAGGTAPTGVYYADAFAAQLNADGSDLVFSTFLGGTGIDSADGVAVDAQGNTYVAGYTYSADFPVTAGALQNAGRRMDRFQGGIQDGFVAKIGAGGAPLMYSTYLGGMNMDEVQGIAADALGFAYVTGYTASTNFPAVHAYRPDLNGWPKLPQLNDAFVARISPAGDTFVYSTFLGGTNEDAGFRIVTDGSGNAYVTGSTFSRDFPNTSPDIPGLKVGFTGASPITGDAFLTKLDGNGVPVFSSRFGGKEEDVGWDLSLDGAGNIFIVGTTSSYTDFPVYAADGWLAPKKDRNKDPIVFVTAFDAEGSALLYSLIYGGAKQDYGYGIAADPAGNAYVVGRTTSPNFPVSDALQGATSDKNDAFISKISLEPTLMTVPGPSSVKIRWRAFAPEYEVEASRPVVGDGTWAPVPDRPSLKEGWHELSVPAQEASTIYRLKRSH